MDFDKIITLSMRHYLLTVFMVLQIFVSAYSQSCKCPTICQPCTGGILTYVLQYNGDVEATISINDMSGVFFSQLLQPGEFFEVIKSDNERFTGNKIFLYINGEQNTSIDVLCNSNVAVNVEFGSFVIVSAINLNGSSICCPIGNKPDKIAPVFTSVPQDIIVFTDEGKCSAIVTWDEPVVDDCNFKSTTRTFDPGYEFPKGTTEVEYIAADKAGNLTPYIFKITVTDGEPPLITGKPEDITQITDDPQGMVVNWVEPEANDNCVLASFGPSKDPGTLFQVGVTEVIYTATDQDGNTAQCSFNVKIDLEKEPDPPPGEVLPEIEISKIITPDGDGKNDSWMIKNIEHYPGNKILVIDRWGSTIFSASNYDNNSTVWDGSSVGGKTVPAGTYFFVISFQKGNEQMEVKGFVELIP
jgi:gliding motility-associated-like protein